MTRPVLAVAACILLASCTVDGGDGEGSLRAIAEEEACKMACLGTSCTDPGQSFEIADCRAACRSAVAACADDEVVDMHACGTDRFVFSDNGSGSCSPFATTLDACAPTSCWDWPTTFEPAE